MSILRATLNSLAEVLSVREDQVEDALASERLVKISMSRRGLFRGATTAVAALALPREILMADAPRIALVHSLSLVDNLAAIDAINRVIVVAFEGLLMLDLSPSPETVAIARARLRPQPPRQVLHRASRRSPNPRASNT